MRIINTDILLESIENVGEIEDKTKSVVPDSFAQAVESSRELDKKADKVFKDKEKESKDKGLNNTEKDRLEGNSDIKRPEGSKKLHLEESLFAESYLNDGDLNHLFFKVLNRSKQYEFDGSDLILTDYNLGDRVGIHLDQLQDYDLDQDIFFNPDDDEDEDLDEELVDKDEYKESKFVQRYPDRFEEIKKIYKKRNWILPKPEDLDEVAKILGVELDEAWRKETAEGDTYLVSRKRAPLADLIQAYLIRGEHEWGYVKHPNGVINPTPLKGAEYEPNQIGIDKDFNIKVTAKSEEELEDAKKIADKFDREYEVKDFTKAAGHGRYPFHLIIKLKDEDWDEPYVNPDDEVYMGEEKIENETLEEAISIKASIYDFKPTGEEARETYDKIKEAGKLGEFQDLLDQMYPDQEEINAEGVNKLLSEKSKWVFDMLDIHDEIEG